MASNMNGSPTTTLGGQRSSNRVARFTNAEVCDDLVLARIRAELRLPSD
jgi:hypothetical protein